MSAVGQAEPTRSDDEIEPGKRLIRVGDGRGSSLAEKVAYLFHRFAWRTPFHALRLSGRAPLKLLAVPKDPIAGDKAAGEALLRGLFVRRHISIPVERLDFADPSLPRDVSDHLQSFAWLRDIAAAATRERASKLAEKLTALWIESYAGQVTERAWRADLWGRRILFWTAYAPYILSSRDPNYRAAVLKTLARGARHIERGAAKAPPGLPRITAWAGVIVAGLVVQGGAARLRLGEAGMARALAASLHDDGGLHSRSPTEQLALVETLSQLRTAYIAAARDMPEAVEDALGGAVAALLGVTLGDEALSSWQGGNMFDARRIAAAIEGSGVDARPLRQARGWGYQRAQAKNAVLVFDAAPPPPTRALSGGCASTLAFELSDGKDRLVVNCGGVAEAGDTLPDDLVQALRTTAAHSTLTLGDRNSTAIHEDGSLGKGVDQVELARDETAGIVRVEATHDGYVRRFGFAHRRQLILSPDGKELKGEDLLSPEGKKKRPAATPFAVRFHLAPTVEVTTTADGQGALLRIRGKTLWQFRCRGGALSVEDSLWLDGEARPHSTLQLVVTGETPPDGITIGWQLKRAS
ncbi:MAG TPA: heparinase II/III family protein [Allosphingosinicella sp.]